MRYFIRALMPTSHNRVIVKIRNWASLYLPRHEEMMLRRYKVTPRQRANIFRRELLVGIICELKRKADGI
jgi:hypothetical protein